MRAAATVLRSELIGLAGVVERNVYLTRRTFLWDIAWFVWTLANTLTIVFIAEGIEATGGEIDVERTTTSLLIGAVVWAYLGVVFEFLAETLGIPKALARRACVAFNYQPERVRCAYFAVLVQGKTVNRYVAEGHGPPERVKADIEMALRTISDAIGMVRSRS